MTQTLRILHLEDNPADALLVRDLLEYDEAVKLLPGVHSAYDKAVKTGVVKRPTANRKKSRLALALVAKPVAAAKT